MILLRLFLWQYTGCAARFWFAATASEVKLIESLLTKSISAVCYDVRAAIENAPRKTTTPLPPATPPHSRGELTVDSTNNLEDEIAELHWFCMNMAVILLQTSHDETRSAGGEKHTDTQIAVHVIGNT